MPKDAARKNPKASATKDRGADKAGNQRECEQVYAAIKRWKAHDGAVLLPVVRSGAVAALREKTKPKWWKMKKASKSTICITTPENLQMEIEDSAADGKVKELFLLISRQVDLPRLQFNVPASISNLYIIRCGHQTRSTGSDAASTRSSSTGSSSPDPSPAKSNSSSSSSSSSSIELRALTHDRLILNGSSTFCGVRLDEWQSKRYGEHNLILGPGVVIELTMGIPWTARDALGSISKQQREEVCRHFRDMCEAKYQDSPQWQRWKEPVNKLLDVAAGTASVTQVIDCYANGIVVQAAAQLTQFGVEGLLKVSAGLLCVSGPGKVVLAGVGVAAAVYFVPWDTVWGWFRAAFGAFLTWLVRAWENFKTWAQSSSSSLSPSATGAGQQVVSGVKGRQGVELTIRRVLTAS